MATRGKLAGRTIPVVQSVQASKGEEQRKQARPVRRVKIDKKALKEKPPTPPPEPELDGTFDFANEDIEFPDAPDSFSSETGVTYLVDMGTDTDIDILADLGLDEFYPSTALERVESELPSPTTITRILDPYNVPQEMKFILDYR